MPNIGDLIKGNDIGYKSHVKLIWVACGNCGTERWVQYVHGKPIKLLCRSCSMKGKTHRYQRSVKAEAEKIIGYRTCQNCGRVLMLSKDFFGIDKESLNGLSRCCKGCRNKKVREYNLRTGKTKQHKFLFKSQRDRRLSASISISLRRAIHSGKNGRHWESLVGYSLEDLKKHLEGLFRNGMTWDNYGYNHKGNIPRMWHIDHITPKVAFNLDSFDSPDIRKCWAMSNLQPLWGDENSRKGDKMEGIFQLRLK